MRISDWSSDVCSSDLQRVARSLHRPQPGACGQHVAPVLGLALVHPQQAALHRHVVVRRPQAGGATILAVPRMRVLVAEQVAAARLLVPVGEVAGAQAVLARALVFQPVAAHLLRQRRSEEHTSELQSLMRISYAVFCLKKKKINTKTISP